MAFESGTLKNKKIIGWVAPSPAFNVNKQIALNLPTKFDDNGLPVGIQLIDYLVTEATLISLATYLETAKP